MVDIKPKVLLRLVRREEEISESFFGKEAESVMPLLRTTLKLNLQHPLPIDTSKPEHTPHDATHPGRATLCLKGFFIFILDAFMSHYQGAFLPLCFL